MSAARRTAASPDFLADCVATVWRWRDEGRFPHLASPLIEARRLGDRLGCELLVKAESMNATGAFKERGACAKLMSLTTSERRAGVAAASAGNHAQGLALHAARQGIRAVIFMAETTPEVKVERTRALGAKVRLFGRSFDEAQAHAAASAQAEGLTYVHPFDDPWVIAGQSTLGRELFEARPDLDAVVAPVGGGGLLAGISLAAEALGVSAERHGVRLAKRRSALTPTLADGMAVRDIGAVPSSLKSRLASRWSGVDDTQIEAAMIAYMRDTGLVAEGAGAAALAALMAEPERYAGKTVAVILSGSNVDPARYAKLFAASAA
ncbi:MAG: threonine ammonia-lyase [Oceanicaulis sp.]